jgi:hypothetical protein
MSLNRRTKGTRNVVGTVRGTLAVVNKTETKLSYEKGVVRVTRQSMIGPGESEMTNGRL